MELLELLTAGDIFFSCLLVELIERSVGKLVRVDRTSEVERDIVHQEPIQNEEDVKGEIKMNLGDLRLELFLKPDD